MILAIEGAPGVGKSTTAAALGAVVIAEVNLLFARPPAPPADWYLDRQNARWEMAQRYAEANDLVVLDGDPFQPLWFNWAMPETGWPPWQQACDFYRHRLLERRMAWPDRYLFLTIDEPTRCARMLARERARGLGEERAQHKTARYARLVEPQARFFRALAVQFPGWVQWLEATSVERSVTVVRQLAAPLPGWDPLVVLEFVESWLRQETP